MTFKSVALKTLLGFTILTSSFAASSATLRIGTEPTFAPFEFMNNASGTYEGFDMDMIREAVKRMGHTPELHQMGFDSLVPSLRTNSIDIIAAAMTITPKRQRAVAFTQPYYDAGQGIMVLEANRDRFVDLKTLEGARIAVQIGTTGAEMAVKIPGAKVYKYNTTNEAILELRNRGVDAVLLDKPVLGYFTVVNPRAAKGMVVQPGVFGAESFGFAVNKQNTQLLKGLNEALDAMRKDGTYDHIYAKWFGTTERR